MRQGLKKFITNIKICRNSKMMASFLSLLFFMGACPLLHSQNKLIENDLVVIHFGPGDANFIAIEEEEINQMDFNPEMSAKLNQDTTY